MKRGLILLLFLTGGIGTLLYITQPAVKSRLDSWIDAIQAHAGQEKLQPDTTSNSSPPAPKPEKRKKIPKLIKPDKYAHLDKYSKSTPEKYARDKIVLAKYLAKPAKGDLEKARVIYSWIATHIRYDDEGFNSGKYKDESADSVFARRTAVCEGFSSLFEELGLLMGLEVKKSLAMQKAMGTNQATGLRTQITPGTQSKLMAPGN